MFLLPLHKNFFLIERHRHSLVVVLERKILTRAKEKHSRKLFAVEMQLSRQDSLEWRVVQKERVIFLFLFHEI